MTAASSAPAQDRALLASVRNAARVLRAFSRAGQELGITELSRQLGLGKSTVHRLVTTLTAERLLERGSTPGRYRLGLVLYELGSNVTEHVDLHQAALPALATLRHETGEMVHVAVLDGLEVVYVERLESHNLLPIFRQVGHRLPAHWTSSGKILLAALPPDELNRLARRLGAGVRDALDHHRQDQAADRTGGGGQARLGAEQRRGAPGHRLGGRADPGPGR